MAVRESYQLLFRKSEEVAKAHIAKMAPGAIINHPTLTLVLAKAELPLSSNGLRDLFSKLVQDHELTRVTRRSFRKPGINPIIEESDNETQKQIKILQKQLDLLCEELHAHTHSTHLHPK